MRLLSCFMTLLFLCIFDVYTTDYLYAPSRNLKITPNRGRHTDSCPFCNELAANNNEKYLILSRKDGIVIQLNPKPYAIGSLLIYPETHTSDPNQLSLITWCDLFLTARQTMELLEEFFLDDNLSFSIGMNIGPNANGSIKSHLHLHVIPRLKNNDGFLEACCGTKLVQYSLYDVYKELKEIMR